MSIAENVDHVLLPNISDMDLGVRKKQLGLINAPWVHEPLIVNMATLLPDDPEKIEEAPLIASVSSFFP
jgi:hypothetical protein